MAEKKQKKIKKKIMEVLSIIAAFGVVVGIVAFFMNMQNSINMLKKDLDEVVDKVNPMYDHIYIDENSINNQLANLNNNVNNLQGQLITISEALNVKVISVTETSTISAIDETIIECRSETHSLQTLLSNTPVGTDIYGELYYSDDLINETMLLTYTEGDKEVYFLGQYNEDYHWDGYCVTNTYNLDGTLYGICESNFDDGHRLDYKSFYLSEDDSQKWVYSDKTCNKNENNGINIVCSLNYGNKKNFTNTNVRVTDIAYVDKFVEEVKPKMLTYYSGNTSDGKYNDNTGNAYEIIYNDDETVKTLYVGRFKNGTFNDDTGDAWDIAYSSEGNYYVYNTGIFKEGSAVNKSTTPIDINQINDIISKREQKFDVELKWK